MTKRYPIYGAQVLCRFQAGARRLSLFSFSPIAPLHSEFPEEGSVYSAGSSLDPVATVEVHWPSFQPAGTDVLLVDARRSRMSAQTLLSLAVSGVEGFVLVNPSDPDATQEIPTEELAHV